MTVQIRSLVHLCALARRLSFARAADELGLSQSALSRSIQALETQLGLRLFDRDRAGVALTPQGRLAVERARLLLADADDFERQMARSASAEAGHVRFGMAPMAARALLPPVLGRRFRDAPDVVNDVHVRDADALWALLVAGEIEFFVTNEGPSFAGPPPRIEVLGHFPVGGLVRAGHPLLRDDPDPAATFPVVRSSWTGLPLPPEIACRMRDAPNVIEDFGSLAAITAASDAIWFSTPYAVTADLASGALRPLPRAAGTPPRTVRMLMVSVERRSASPWARALRGLLRAEIRRLGDAYG